MTAQLLQLETVPDLVDQVYRALLDAISAGAWRPGNGSRRKNWPSAWLSRASR